MKGLVRVVIIGGASVLIWLASKFGPVMQPLVDAVDAVMRWVGI